MYKFLSQIPNPYVYELDDEDSYGIVLYLSIPGIVHRQAFNGVHTVGNDTLRYFAVREYIRYYMLEHDLMTADVTITLEEAGTLIREDAFTVIYCDRQVHGITADQFTANRFFRSGWITCITPGVEVLLPYILPAGNYVQQTVTSYTGPDGTPMELIGYENRGHKDTIRYTPQEDGDIAYDDITSVRISLYPVRDGSADLNAEPLKILMLPTHGSKVSSFRFRNIFNALEVFSVPCEIIRSPETEFEQAVCDGQAQRYDVHSKMPHQVKFGVIFTEQLETIRQLGQAMRAEFWYHNRWLPIIITDYKAEDSNDPATSAEPEMTFEFADQTIFAEFDGLFHEPEEGEQGGEQGGGTVNPDQPVVPTPGKEICTLDLHPYGTWDYGGYLPLDRFSGVEDTEYCVTRTQHPQIVTFPKACDIEITGDLLVESWPHGDGSFSDNTGVEIILRTDAYIYEIWNTGPVRSALEFMNIRRRMWHCPAGSYLQIYSQESGIAQDTVMYKSNIHLVVKYCDGH